jgi:predicted TIM-barrel fold metal-dependent hydrolase
MTSRSLTFPVFDADNHMYETDDALTKFLPREHKDKIAIVDVHGKKRLMVNNRVSHMIPNPTFERVAAPGSAEEYFMGNNPENKTFREYIGPAIMSPPAFRDPAPRLELMNELGLDYATMYPTLASLIEERTRDDVALTHVMIHSLNQWMHEHWTFNYSDRIFATPVITLPLVDRAVEEFHWCLERGMKTFLLRPAPVPQANGGSKSMGFPEYDAFWSEVVAAGIPVTLHGSDTGYFRHLAEWEGGGDEYLSFTASPLRDLVMGHRDIEDTVAALICHGVPTRFPELKFLIIENGSSWVPHLLERLAHSYKVNRRLYAEDPVEVFKRNFWVHPFREDDPRRLIQTVGADRVLFGSDYPHPEGMADPLSFVDTLTGLVPGDDVARIMGGNMAELLGIDMKLEVSV